MYKNYIFDLYGTLIDINTDESKLSFWKKVTSFINFNGANYQVKELKQKYEEFCALEKEKLMKKYDYEVYDIKIEKVFKQLYLYKNIKPSKQLVVSTCQFFRIQSTKFLRLYDGVIDLLTSLKNKNKKIYLLSNAQFEFTYYEMIALDIVKYFDGILISSNVGCCKPDIHFYDKLFKKYHLKKNESIMIGNDSTCDIKGANAFGIDSLYIYSDISPKDDNKNEINSTYKIMDGDFTKVKNLILL